MHKCFVRTLQSKKRSFNFQSIISILWNAEKFYFILFYFILFYFILFYFLVILTISLKESWKCENRSNCNNQNFWKVFWIQISKECIKRENFWLQLSSTFALFQKDFFCKILNSEIKTFILYSYLKIERKKEKERKRERERQREGEGGRGREREGEKIKLLFVS